MSSKTIYERVNEQIDDFLQEIDIPIKHRPFMPKNLTAKKVLELEQQDNMYLIATLPHRFEQYHHDLKERLKLMYPEEHKHSEVWPPRISTFGEIKTYDIKEGEPKTLFTDDPRNKAKRYNSGKPQLSYVMSTGVALDGVANVMEFGAKKYDRDNWKKGFATEGLLDSLLRHVRSYLDGEYLDADSGLPHIDHIACNALFLGYHTNRETQDGMK